MIARYAQQSTRERLAQIMHTIFAFVRATQHRNILMGGLLVRLLSRLEWCYVGVLYSVMHSAPLASLFGLCPLANRENYLTYVTRCAEVRLVQCVQSGKSAALHNR